MKIRSRTIAPLLGLFGVAIISGGCEQASSPTAPEPTALHLVEAAPPTSGGGASYALLATPSDSAVASIGYWGGTLSLGGHTLTVPRGAVSDWTRFVMSDPDPLYIGVSLTATSCSNEACLTRGSQNDVGAAGFAKPLDLKLSYAKALFVPDANLLVVVHVTGEYPRVVLDPQPTTIDQVSRTITGSVSHFSRYAIGSN